MNLVNYREEMISRAQESELRIILREAAQIIRVCFEERVEPG